MIGKKPSNWSMTVSLILLGSIGCLALILPACSRSSDDDEITPPASTSGTLISVNGPHVAIYLRDFDGNPIDIETETTPYSPKQTCGYCHDYHTIEGGYHFQQGAEDLADDFGSKNGTYDFVLSLGMVGKW